MGLQAYECKHAIEMALAAGFCAGGEEKARA
jgi:hypothetical protein